MPTLYSKGDGEVCITLELARLAWVVLSRACIKEFTQVGRGSDHGFTHKVAPFAGKLPRLLWVSSLMHVGPWLWFTHLGWHAGRWRPHQLINLEGLTSAFLHFNNRWSDGVCSNVLWNSTSPRKCRPHQPFWSSTPFLAPSRANFAGGIWTRQSLSMNDHPL